MPLIWLLVTPEEVLLSCDGAVRRNVEASLSLSLSFSLSLFLSLSLCVYGRWASVYVRGHIP